jgi:hypothetical protein
MPQLETRNPKLETVDIFFGDANPAQARIYARLDSALMQYDQAETLRFDGRLIGPECDFARTLPAHIPFTTLRHGNTLLAEAVIPDPCFWTPDLPFLYRAELKVRHDDQTLQSCECIFGIRRLSVRDRSLIFDGKRFVLRAVRLQETDGGLEAVAAFARETWTALVVPQPSDELCNFASRRGVLLIADVSKPLSPRGRGQGESAGLAELRRLSHWPAIGIALLNADAALPADIHNRIPNLLLAQSIPANLPLKISPWAQLAFVERTAPADFSEITQNCNVPMIAFRPSPQSITLEQSRAACDTLQTELASQGDFAGYVA